MQISMQALIYALRGAANALEVWEQHVQEGDTLRSQAPVEPTPPVEPPKKRGRRKKGEVPEQAQEEYKAPLAPEEDEEPPQAPTPPPDKEEKRLVSEADIKALFGRLAQQGKIQNADVFELLNQVGINRVGEATPDQRATLYALMERRGS